MNQCKCGVLTTLLVRFCSSGGWLQAPHSAATARLGTAIASRTASWLSPLAFGCYHNMQHCNTPSMARLHVQRPAC